MAAGVGEFELIEVFRAHAGGGAGQGLRVGPGDDAAVLAPPPDRELVITVDTAVAGRHFPEGAPAELIGARALAMNLSDLAAMGAAPWCAFLALTVPRGDADFVAALARGWHAMAQPCGVLLAGGNVSRGELSLSITLVGTAAPGAALTRRGARPGDALWVSGRLGLAAAGLQRALEAQGLDDLAGDPALARYWAPEPRIALGRALVGVATACVDVSDGLLADLSHLLAASDVGGCVRLENVPVAGEADRAVTAGDDYELCFSAPPAGEARVRAAAREAGVPVACIGEIRAGGELSVLWRGRPVAFPRQGYRHFE